MINTLIKRNGITKYSLAQNSDLPYTTVCDICSGKSQLEKCSAETIYKLAKALDVTMETLLSPYIEKRCTFELFKSNVCHRVKEMGDIEFMIDTLENDRIRYYYDKKWYAESLYLLAMLDYLSRMQNIPLCDQYNDLRKFKLKEPLFPTGVLAAAAVSENRNKIMEAAIQEAIPEFIRFNIVESEIRNVI